MPDILTQRETLDELAKLRARIAAMKIPAMPADPGYQLDSFWAMLFGQDIINFRKYIKAHRIPHARWGLNMLVRKDDIEQHLATTIGKPYHKSKAGQKRARRKPTGP